jgi:prephenate dehydrogenase
MRPETHDLLVSRSSHLPHLLAAQLANFVLEPRFPPEQRLLCANGFKDTTRIASSSPEMWRDIALANRKHLGRALDDYMRQLGRFRRALSRGDSRQITGFFEQARQRRDQWVLKLASLSSE